VPRQKTASEIDSPAIATTKASDPNAVHVTIAAQAPDAIPA
jgi:hypothetical protein